MDSLTPASETAKEVGLRYVHDDLPGITRRPCADGFSYFSPKGEQISDEKTLQRIRSLAIPPAYWDVWICPYEDGHLQATGKDARGRKQYRYHPRFREVRDESKFAKMVDFAQSLPTIHARLDRDLAKKGLPREKVLAAVVELLEKSFIRVGNEEYAKQNKSYGLTTLRTRHVHIEGAEIAFNFMGKSKVKHRITLRDRKLANVVKKIQELPGQELFHYLDPEGNPHTVNSHDVNAYLHEISDHPFTAKDFRTWAGTVLALVHLAGAPPEGTKKQQKALLNSAIKEVAKQLGNTPSVCRKCYIHPTIVEDYTTGILHRFLSERGESDGLEAEASAIHSAEDIVIELLKTCDSVKIEQAPRHVARKPVRNRRVA